MKRHLSSVLFLGGGLMIGLLVGWFLKTWQLKKEDIFGDPLRDANSSYAYVKPLLACNVGSIEDPAMDSLKAEIDTNVNNAIRNGKAKNVSVYYKDLGSGGWTGVNEEDTYVPASLAKVPLLITALRQSQSDPTFFSRVLTLKTIPSADDTQEVLPEETLEAGKEYSVEDLLRLMIVYSDNRATQVLMSLLDQKQLKDVFDDLEMDQPKDQSEYTISPRQYSRFLRALYNGSILSPDLSEKALGLLAQATYKDGLRAGVDASVPIAHKFGEVASKEDDGSVTRDLHDCGIVYTQNPYLLCVMTQGEDLNDLAGVVSEISKTVYDYNTSFHAE